METTEQWDGVVKMPRGWGIRKVSKESNSQKNHLSKHKGKINIHT